MHAESGGPGSPEPMPVPRLGIGTIVRHLQFGVGRIVAHEPGQYVLAFRTDSPKAQGEDRAVSVAVARPGGSGRTIRGDTP